MDNHNDVERPPMTLAGTAPVAMQHGRRGDRIVAARLRAQRRWLVRDQDKAGLVPDPPAADIALLVVRVVVGVIFLAHAGQKLGDLATFQAAFASMGIPVPEVTVPLVSGTEIVCGLLLIAGLATRLSGLALAGNMVVAFFTAHVGNGFFVEDGGFELVLLLGAASIALTLTGAGRFSVDGALGVTLRLARG